MWSSWNTALPWMIVIIHKYFRCRQPIRIKYSIDSCNESNQCFTQWPLTSEFLLLQGVVLVWLWGQIWHILLADWLEWCSLAWNLCIALSWKLKSVYCLIINKGPSSSCTNPFVFHISILCIPLQIPLFLSWQMSFAQCQLLFQTTLVSFCQSNVLPMFSLRLCWVQNF